MQHGIMMRAYFQESMKTCRKSAVVGFFEFGKLPYSIRKKFSTILRLARNENGYRWMKFLLFSCLPPSHD